MSDEIGPTAATLITVILIMVGMVMGAFIGDGAHTRNVDECQRLSEEIGRSTLYRNGDCFVEIAPDTLVEDVEVIYWLDHVKPVEGVGEKSR